jgi:hypothetical protein
MMRPSGRLTRFMGSTDYQVFEKIDRGKEFVLNLDEYR